MATLSSILAWRIPGTEEPGGLLSMGSHRVRHDEVTWQQQQSMRSQSCTRLGNCTTMYKYKSPVLSLEKQLSIRMGTPHSQEILVIGWTQKSFMNLLYDHPN